MPQWLPVGIVLVVLMACPSLFEIGRSRRAPGARFPRRVRTLRTYEGFMIDLYSWPTSNGHKVHIMLEECGLPYRAHPIVIGKAEQFQPWFLKISPNNKTPAMIDR